MEADLTSSATKIQVRVERQGNLHFLSIPHGYDFFATKIRQVRGSLLCPDFNQCKWCQSVVERARSLATANIDVFY